VPVAEHAGTARIAIWLASFGERRASRRGRDERRAAARHDPAKFFRAGLPGHRSIFRLDADGRFAGCGYRKARWHFFDGKALFYVRGDTLGFAIPSGAVAIVEVEPYPGRDRNLVIARYQGNVFARRLLKAPGTLGISLAAQMPDPRTPRPTMTYDESKVRLHRIVGAIFTDMPPPLAGGGEATPVDTAPELARIEVAYRVREDSAVPLALPGQVILGGAELTQGDLDALEGRLIAVTLDDGTSIFKRVGARLPGSLAYLRQFESIGGLGSSMVIATEAVDRGTSTAVMAYARRVLGVLYERS